MNKENKIIIAVAIVVIILIALFAIFNLAGGRNGNQAVSKDNLFEGQMSLERLAEISSCPLTADKNSFAKCLTDKGFTMYGAVWCSHCTAQKALFGDSFKYIKYVECPDNINICLDKGVQGYPTWIREVKN
ncbi:MAG: hypothetical protein WC631_02010 [Candidatus Paceibacterota bacterium]|jgi:hypothetical protein